MSAIKEMTSKELFELVGKEINLHVEIGRFVEIRTSKAIVNFNNVSGYAYIEMLEGNKEYRVKIVD